MNANKNMKKDDSSSFQTVWKVGAGDNVGFNINGLYTVDWGDGCVEQFTWASVTNNLNHVYVKQGEYTVSISSGVTEFWISEESAKKLIEIKQWGRAQWESMHSMFSFAINMVCTATDSPDLSKVENMGSMFYNCQKFNSPIEHWDVSQVRNIRNALAHAELFNQPLALWDLSSALEVSYMLFKTPAFAQDLRDFKTSSKVNTNELFGWEESLAQYNEKYDAQEQQQDVYSVLDGAGACDRKGTL